MVEENLLPEDAEDNHILTLPKRVLFVVNEPGEFKELLKLAKDLKKNGTERVTFLFCRPDYTSFSLHCDLCRENDCFSMMVNPLYSSSEIKNYLWEPYQEDYLPTHLSAKKYKGTKPKALTKKPNIQTRKFMFLLYRALSVTLGIPNKILQMIRPKSSNLRKTVGELRSIYANMVSYQRMKRFFYNLCESENPDAIIFGQDYAGSFNAAASVIARKKFKIPVITMPFAMGTTKELNEALFYYPDYRVSNSWLSRKVAKKFPKWINVYKGKDLMRFPAGQVVAAEIENLSAPSPWLPYSGYTYFLASSRQSFDYYVAAGMEPAKIYLTGSYNDEIWKRERIADSTSQFTERKVLAQKEKSKINFHAAKKISQAIGEKINSGTGKAQSKSDLLTDLIINPIDLQELRRRKVVVTNALSSMIWQKNNENTVEGKLIVVSWPTNQFSRPVTGLEFDNYEEVSRFWALALHEIAETYGAIVLVSLHPTLLNQNFDYLEDEFGFKIWPGALTDILPHADLFVSCVSSTLFWAFNLGVPSINYDCYKYGYTEFDETGAIKTVSSRSDFSELLDRLFVDEVVYEKMKENTKSGQEYWGFSDGKSPQRILAAISDIMVRGV